jgi:hypothetical protein
MIHNFCLPSNHLMIHTDVFSLQEHTKKDVAYVNDSSKMKNDLAYKKSNDKHTKKNVFSVDVLTP